MVNTVKNGKVLKVGIPNISKKVTTKKVNRNNLPTTRQEYLSVAETINGRVAMIAWDFGVLKDWCTGQTIEQQFDSSLPEITVISLLLTFASFITLKDPDREDGPIWKKESELINGRAAMVGISILTLYQIMHSYY